MVKRVYVKSGDQEIEVEGDNAFIDKNLKAFFQRLGYAQPSIGVKDLPANIVAAAKSGKVIGPAEYYRQKTPRGGTETLVVLAKYLDEFRNKGEFKRKDINAVAKEARLALPHAQYYANAVKQGLLRNIGRGTYGLSITGEDAVAAMPFSKKG